MISIYFKQVWRLIKEEKVFSLFYIIATGLGIALPMALFIGLYLQVVNIYPEKKRDRMLIIREASMRYDEKRSQTYYKAGTEILKWCQAIKEAETTAIYGSEYYQKATATHLQEKELFTVNLKQTDANYFTVFQFDFVAGAPFLESDFQNKTGNVVVAQSFAEKMFGSAQGSLGQPIKINGQRAKIVGVVRDASPLTTATYGDIYLPYTYHNTFEDLKEQEKFVSGFSIYMAVKDKKDIPLVINKVQEKEKEYNQTNPMKNELKLEGQPKLHWHWILFNGSNKSHILLIGGLALNLLLLLLIPALNLNGMIASNLKKRLPEIGIRKAFGATDKSLYKLILGENFLLTCLGGCFGILLSWGLLMATQSFIPTIFNGAHYEMKEFSGYFRYDMLFSPSIFIFLFLVCLLLNLTAAFIPTYHALHKDIVYSLNEKI